SFSNGERLLNVWPSECTIASDVSIDDSFDTTLRHRPRKINRHRWCRSLPAARHHATITRVDPNADPRRESVNKLLQCLRRFSSDRSHHNPRHTHIAELPDIV